MFHTHLKSEMDWIIQEEELRSLHQLSQISGFTSRSKQTKTVGIKRLSEQALGVIRINGMIYERVNSLIDTRFNGSSKITEDFFGVNKQSRKLERKFNEKAKVTTASNFTLFSFLFWHSGLKARKLLQQTG